MPRICSGVCSAVRCGVLLIVPQVKGMLEQYRIGRLKGGLPAKAMADPYANEPQRLPALIVRTQKPMNAGGCTAGRGIMLRCFGRRCSCWWCFTCPSIGE